jgi:putative transcriptional regulator
MSSLQGQFIIAAPRLVDPNFAKSVVLLVRHGEDGALGLIVNRPLTATLDSIWGQVSEEPCLVDNVLYQGGPCDGPLMVLHTDPSLSQFEVGDGVHFTADKEAIEQLVASQSTAVKFFVGYAGWAVGQLEAELAEGSWLTTPATKGHMLYIAERSWDILLGRARRAAVFPWLNPKHIPDDPSVN